MTRDELAQAWVAERKLSPTPQALDMARGRVDAWGRLASTSLVHLPPPVRVRVLEHGPDLVAQGCAFAEVWVRAADAEQCQRMAGEIHRVVRDSVWPTGLLLVVAVHRARWWDRWL